jgi:hypothetical protein
VSDQGNKPHAIADPNDYHDVFEVHRAGQKIYEDLITRFGARPKNSSGIDRILDNAEYQGQRAVIEFITMRINQYHGVPDDETELAE